MDAARDEAVSEFFGQNVEDYEAKHYGDEVRSFMTVRQHHVLSFVDGLSLCPGASVLDAGCGPGFILEALARRGFRAHGLDGADTMLRSARGRITGGELDHPVSFTQGNIESLPYSSATFDLVSSTGVIEYLRTDVQVLSEMHRVLKPGGVLILSVTNLWSPINCFDFVAEGVKRSDMLRKGFNSVWTRLGNRPLLPRHFKVRRHSPDRFRRSLAEAGFNVIDDTYFHFLPWPRPFDRLMPRASARLGRRLEGLARSRHLRWLGEGYLVLCEKPSA